jgi:hypothetical protein
MPARRIRNICIVFFCFALTGISATLLAQTSAASQVLTAQAAPTNWQAESSCGDFSVNFKVSAVDDNSAPAVVAGKARMYVVNDADSPSWTIRVGMDGKWLGANKGRTYLYSVVDPGVHHVCISNGGENSFASFTALPGGVYYFRSRSRIASYSEMYETVTYSLDFSPIDADEGAYLVAMSDHSLFKIKK